jgi:hypothetical protein
MMFHISAMKMAGVSQLHARLFVDLLTKVPVDLINVSSPLLLFRCQCSTTYQSQSRHTHDQGAPTIFASIYRQPITSPNHSAARPAHNIQPSTSDFPEIVSMDVTPYKDG